jgi:hypothetical protein
MSNNNSRHSYAGSATQPAFDQELYVLIQPLLFEDYRYLVPTTRAKTRQNFLNSLVDEPQFSYRRLRNLDFAKYGNIVGFIEPQISNHKVEIVRQVYSAKIAEVRQKLDMLEAADRGDDRAFHKASVLLYGGPKEEIFNFTLREVGQKLRMVSDKCTHAKVDSFLIEVDGICAGAGRRKFAWEGQLPRAREFSDQGHSVTAKQIVALCETALHELAIDDWQVRISHHAGSTNFDTDHSTKTVFVPRDADIAARKKLLTEARAKALIAHEIRTHVARRVSGERSKLQLLGLGLDHYLKGEEGIATYMEQMILGADEFSGEARYLAISLGCGMDGEPRGFRDLWKIMRAYMVVKLLYDAIADKRMIDIEKILKVAPVHAWLQCLRTFRGTTGSTAGAVYTKDLVYREGNIDIWKLIRANSDWVNYFHLGKFDPANALHRGIMCQLGLLDRALSG